MSRNKRRVNIPQPTQQNTQPNIPQPPAEANPFGLSFVIPTELVPLPSSGLLYSENSPVHGMSNVEVKAMTAVQEDILINRDYIENGTVFDRLIDSIMVTPGVRSQDLLECDKMAILMSARKTGYGDIVEFTTECDNCSTKVTFDVSLTSILEKNKNQDSVATSTEEWEYSEASKTFAFTLPTTNLPVKIRLMTPEDIKNLEAAKKQKEKLNLPFNQTIEFVRTVLVEASGIVDQANLNKLAEVLPAGDVRKIRAVHNQVTPDIETTQSLTCPECNHEMEKEVPFSLGWFWS